MVRMAVAAGVVASQVATAEAYSLASASAQEVHVEAAAETAAEAVADSAVLSCLAKCAEPPAAHALAEPVRRRSEPIVTPRTHAKASDGGLASPIFSPATSPTLVGSPGKLATGDEAETLLSLDEVELGSSFNLNGLEELDPAVVSAPGKKGASLPMTDQARALLQQVNEAVATGGSARLIEDDSDSRSSSSYYIQDQDGTRLAVFKPCDEEASSAGVSAAVKRGCAVGEGANREYLAYMLDMQSPAEFRAGVPETALVRLQHPALFDGQEKIGSLQRFRANRGGAEDWGAPSFSRNNVQNIAVFDLLTLNLDRHGGNMLVAAESAELIPIDHGCALPSELGEPWLDWRLWEQAAQPIDEATQSFVRNLDPLAAAPLTEELGLGDGVWRTVCVMTLLLQLSIGQGKTLRQLADLMMQQEGESSPGLVERLRGDLREAGAAAKAVEGEEWPWSSADAAQTTWAEHCKHAVAAAQA